MTIRVMRTLTIAAVAALLAGCRDEVPTKFEPGQTVTVRGTVQAGVECPMLALEGTDRRVSLAGSLDRFAVGDRVCVRGTVAGMSICMAGEATVEVIAIAHADSCP
jgi:hypothetical protein